MTSLARKSKTGASRKKPVTLISISVEKLIEFDRIRTEEFEISFGGLGRRHRHPALDTALECSVLVKREIVGRLLPQQIDDLRQ